MQLSYTQSHFDAHHGETNEKHLFKMTFIHWIVCLIACFVQQIKRIVRCHLIIYYIPLHFAY